MIDALYKPLANGNDDGIIRYYTWDSCLDSVFFLFKILCIRDASCIHHDTHVLVFANPLFLEYLYIHCYMSAHEPKYVHNMRIFYLLRNSVDGCFQTFLIKAPSNSLRWCFHQYETIKESMVDFWAKYESKQSNFCLTLNHLVAGNCSWISFKQARGTNQNKLLCSGITILLW